MHLLPEIQLLIYKIFKRYKNMCYAAHPEITKEFSVGFVILEDISLDSKGKSIDCFNY